MKAHQAMMDHCEKCMKAAKDAGMGEEPEESEKVAPSGDAAKIAALEKQVADMAKTNAETLELVKKLPANAIIPQTGAVAVEKTAVFEDLLVAK